MYSSGTNNLITRNLIYNTDYSGTYACCIALHGSGEIVTFNTAHSSGRDILRPEGTGSDIRFNDLSDPGLLCKDLGVTYQWGVNGGERASPSTGCMTTPRPTTLIAPEFTLITGAGISSWTTMSSGTAASFDGILINGPATNHLIYNNTLFNCYNLGTHPYDSWPGGNPDPGFWTSDVYTYSASNNLFLATSPQIAARELDE